MAEVKIFIRKATIKDLKDILRLNLELFLKEYKEFDKTLDTEWTFGKDGKKFFRNAIVKKDNFCEVVENKNEIIGYLNGGVAKMIPWHKKPNTHIWEVYLSRKNLEIWA